MINQMPGKDSSHGEADDEDVSQEWDADDSRRQQDQFAPPMNPCECCCMHCRRRFMSDQIWFQKIKGGGEGFAGFWMCPTPNCGGAGFTFDIFPTDPNHPANEGWFDGDDEPTEPGARTWDEDDFETDDAQEAPETQAEYDPQEPQYKAFDEWCDDEDVEGEEWKLGLAPGERSDSSEPQWLTDEEKMYDEPDQRPRELDWTDREKPNREWPDRGPGPMEDDIPF